MMAKYRLLENAFMSPRPGLPTGLVRSGMEVEFDGVPGFNMQPLDMAARNAFREVARTRSLEDLAAGATRLGSNRMARHIRQLAELISSTEHGD